MYRISSGRSYPGIISLFIITILCHECINRISCVVWDACIPLTLLMHLTRKNNCFVWFLFTPISALVVFMGIIASIEHDPCRLSPRLTLCESDIRSVFLFPSHCSKEYHIEDVSRYTLIACCNFRTFCFSFDAYLPSLMQLREQHVSNRISAGFICSACSLFS